MTPDTFWQLLGDWKSEQLPHLRSPFGAPPVADGFLRQFHRLGGKRPRRQNVRQPHDGRQCMKSYSAARYRVHCQSPRFSRNRNTGDATANITDLQYLMTIKHSRQKTATNSAADNEASSVRSLLSGVDTPDLTIDSAHDREAFTTSKSTSMSGSAIGTDAMRGAANTSRIAHVARRWRTIGGRTQQCCVGFHSY